ncbi:MULTISPECIES: hypothetical protein [Pseudomonas]|uniref:hypothetical protein n=1 Tax=Pseudomonas TaxID=286 RepID=UPI001C803575|nr:MULTISPECIES: hypothetical protein [Pseudomonas]MDG9930348.1 hypothetical protein [Pseudomonas sp. GD04042]MDH0484539.1 hypothetical protein [Pseudomonas sp. GD04015]MDH0606003.1 hypothetical protein [Pseudomonas sp. GD03869]
MGTLQLFSIGVLSLVGGLAMVTLYGLYYLTQAFGAWTGRGEKPKDRLSFFIPFSFAFGLAIGSFAQGIYDMKPACDAAGQPLFFCLASIAQS